MRKIYLINVVIATLAYFANAAQADVHNTTFKVIHTPSYNVRTGSRNRQHTNKMGVRIEGSDHVYILDNTKSADRLVHIGTAPSTNKSYQYVIVDKNNKVIESEPFYRSSVINGGPSFYEFYGRINTIRKATQAQQLPHVNYRYKNAEDDYKYKKGLDRGQVHPIDEIPTFHIQSNPADFRTLHERVLQDIGINANVTRITSNNIEQFENAKIELSGQTSRLFRKLSYSVTIDKAAGNALNGYRRFKLRSCATDPSYIREKIYYDMLDASQLPSAKASFIRLFVNEEPQGLYLIVDNYKNPFLKNTFGNNNGKYKHGALYQGSMQENPLAIGQLQKGANLGYLGPHINDYVEPSSNTSAYKVQEPPHGAKPGEELKDLVSFIDFVHKTASIDHDKKKDEKELAHTWNKKFDVSLFLKHMAFEILMGHNDGYMGAAHNYVLYQDPDQKGRFIWLASDLDQTLGSTLIAPRSKPARSALEQLDRYGLLDNAAFRPLINQLFQIKSFSKQFYQIFSDLHHSLFKTNAISAHLMFLRDLIEQDVTWDKQIDRYRVDNFQNNRTIYDNQLNQKVLQLPLGRDFFSRINKIDFNTAVGGTIEGHPSITSLAHWFEETSEFLDEFITASSEFLKE